MLDEIDRTLIRRNQYLYAVFIDFRAAFDSGSRRIALENLAAAGVPFNVLQLTTNILQENSVGLDDGACVREGLIQTDGFTLGDNLSPLLFTVLVANLSAVIRNRHRNVDLIQFADDIVLFSTSRFHLQQSLHTLNIHVTDLSLQINTRKTEAMKFRRGGRLAKSDTLRIGNQELLLVNRFTYLGITLSLNGRSFSAHVVDRCKKALAAISIRSIPTRRSRLAAFCSPQVQLGAAPTRRMLNSPQTRITAIS